MARGTLVGEAFIRVHADNTAFAREIATGMRGLKEGADEQGRGWGKQFFDAVKSELEQKMEREFKQGFLTGDFTNFAKNFGTMEEALGTINQRLATMRRWGGLSREEFDDLANTVERFRRGVINVADVRSMEEYAASLTKAAKEMGTLRDGSNSTALSTAQLVRHMDTWDDQVSKSRQGFDQWAATMTKAAEAMGHLRERTDEESLDLHDLLRVIDEGRDFEALADKMTKASHEMGLHRDNVLATSIAWKDMEKHIAEFGKSDAIKKKVKDVEDLDHGVGILERTFIRLGRRLERVDVSRVFGKGSRNDFLNIVGSVIGGITNMTESIVGFATKGVGLLGTGLAKLGSTIFGNLITNLRNSSEAFDEFVTTLQQGLGGIGKVAGPVITALVTLSAVSGGVVLGISLLGEALGVVTSALSLFLGGVIAAAGAIETALIGAVVVAAPLLVGLAGAIGTVVVAFANMSDKTKKAFEPLQNQFKKIAESIEKTFFKDIPLWVKTASDLLKTFAGPTMERVATQVRDAISGIAKDFEKPEIKKALDAWGAALGPIAGNLTTAFGKALEGALAFFQPILPLAVQLSESIKKTADTFAAWAQSAAGQNAIKDFFTTAWQEAQTLWQILLNVGGALQTLLNAGNTAVGKEFLGWLEEKTGDLKRFLESPEGQNQLALWFDEAKRFAENLWTTLEKIGGALKALDSPANREFANKLIISIGKLADIIAALVPTFEVVGKAVGVVLTIIARFGASMLLTVSQVSKAFSILAVAIGGFTHNEGLVKLGEDMARVSASTEIAAAMLGSLPDDVDIAFNGNPLDLVADAETAQGAINGVDKEHSTAFTGSVTSKGPDPNKQALKTVTDHLIPDLLTGVPPEYTTKFEGDPGPIKTAADQVTAELAAVGTDHFIQFNADLSQLQQKMAQANDEIIQTTDPTYVVKFDGDARALKNEAATAGVEMATHVPHEWLTTFEGWNQPLSDETKASMAILDNFGETHGESLTRFLGNIDDVDSKSKDANRSVDSVKDENTTFMKGEDSQLQTTVRQVNGALNTIPPTKQVSLFLNLTDFQKSVLYAKSLLNSLGDARVNAAGRASGAIVGMAKGAVFGAMAGTVLKGPQLVLAGEAGPEAIVPLRRSLGRVDPAVRGLSAIAQGMIPMGGISIAEGAIQVSVPNANPVNVAESVLDRLVARLS